MSVAEAVVEEVPASKSPAPDVAACKAYLRRLLRKGDLAELGGYIDAIDSWGAKRDGSPEAQVHDYAMRAFRAAVRNKAAKIVKLIDGGLWDSDPCTALHLSVVTAHATLVAMDEKAYRAVVKDRDSYGLQAVADVEEEAVREYFEPPKVVDDGYKSDDSDDDFEDDVFDDDFARVPVDLSSGGSVAVRRKKKARVNAIKARIRRMEELEKKRKEAGKQKLFTFRYQEKNEPSPNEILQRVRSVREESQKIDFGRDDEHLAMAAIHYLPQEWTAKVEKDFQAAKKLFAAGNIKGLDALDTQFCVAQYRGITYKTTQFDSRARQISRSADETGRGIYSFSAMRAAGVAPSDYFGGRCNKEELERLQTLAEQLKQVLVAKREPRKVVISGTEFDSHADAIQHIYTNEYDYFHSSVASFLANRENYLADQTTHLALVRKRVHTDGTLERRMKQTVALPEFNYEVGLLKGKSADSEDDMAAYAAASGRALPEKIFKRRARAGKVGAFRETEYPAYKVGKEVLENGEWQRLIADYSGREATVESYVEYCDDVATVNAATTRVTEEEAVAAYLKDRYGFIPPDDWQLFDGLLNGDCPFVSTGDNPRHALKYAYGMKFYAGHYDERLLPDWNEDGVARRPYCGKVFVTLHSLTSYLRDAPNHVPSMNLLGRIIIGDAIADEREATFPSYIPGDRCIIEHIAKLPSFPGDDPEESYRRVQLLKYGLDRELFTELHGELRDAQAREPEYRKAHPKKPKPKDKKKEEKDEGPISKFLQKVCAWLVNYQEARLVEIARRCAAVRGMFLVYRNSLGELDRTPTPSQVSDAVRLPSHLGLPSLNPMELRSMRSRGASSDPKNKAEIVKQQRDAWLNPRRALAAHLAGLYDIQATLGDGNCLFHALAGILNHSLDTAHVFTATHVRTIVVNRLSRSKDLRRVHRIDGAYLAEMARPAVMPGQVSRWGGDVEIIAFCRLFSARIRVYAPTYPPPTYSAEWDPPPGVEPRFTGYLHHVHGNHWEWLIPRAV